MSDEFAVTQIVYRMARSSDRNDIAGLVDAMADDAQLVVGDRTITGRHAIFEFFGGPGATLAERERSKHVITNVLVDKTNDGYRTTAYFQVLRSWGLASWGRYVDDFVDGDNGWIVLRREVIPDGNLDRPKA